MRVSPPALGRPMDLGYASNRFIVAATPLLGTVAGVVALIRGETLWDAIGWGIATGGTSFLAWAIAREVHPDRVRVAGVATFVAPAGLAWGRPDLLAAATVLLVARAVAGTTGRALRPADVVLLGAVGLPIVSRGSGAAVLAIGALGLALTLPWADRRRAVLGAAVVLYVGAAIAAIVLSDGVSSPTGDEWVLVAIGIAAGLVALLGPGPVSTIEDRTGGGPVRSMRVRAARGVALGAGVGVSLTFDPAAMGPVWAALVAVALRPR